MKKLPIKSYLSKRVRVVKKRGKLLTHIPRKKKYVSNLIFVCFSLEVPSLFALLPAD